MSRFCCSCDYPIETKVVDGFSCPVCSRCSKIEGGYIESEGKLVAEIRGRLGGSNDYLVASMLMIFRRHESPAPAPMNVPGHLDVDAELAKATAPAYKTEDVERLVEEARKRDRGWFDGFENVMVYDDPDLHAALAPFTDALKAK